MRGELESWMLHAEQMKPLAIHYFGEVSNIEFSEIKERGFTLERGSISKELILRRHNNDKFKGKN
jgi:hypothetical protein